MHRTPLFAGTASIIFALLFVLVLAAGFGVDLAQAVTQSLPILLAAGAAIALSTEIFRRELA